jgi:streptogramin lyase
VKRAHHLHIDQQGLIWLSDIGNHTVRQFTPEEKLPQLWTVPK